MESACLTSGHDIPRRALYALNPYPEAFFRKVLDLVTACRPVAQVAADLGISDQTIYAWRKQELTTPASYPA
jgi:DNA-binding phage protein